MDENERDPICKALDIAIQESGLSNGTIARAMGTNDQNIGRWRRNNTPSRDAVAEIERVLGKPLGYVSRLAGYVAEPSKGILDVIKETPLLSDKYKPTMLEAMDHLIKMTAKERKRSDNR